MIVINNGSIGRQVNITDDVPFTFELRARKPKKWAYLVVIIRDGIPTVTGFNDFAEATAFYDLHGLQWSDSYLCDVMKGPVV